jgi:hypothetical protein
MVRIVLFPNFGLYGDVGIIRVSIVGSNGYMCDILGENGVFRIFDEYRVIVLIAVAVRSMA